MELMQLRHWKYSICQARANGAVPVRNPVQIGA
jgi:hypothetical protein